MDLCWQSNVSAFKYAVEVCHSFLPRSKHLLISSLQSPSAVILEPSKLKSVTVSIVSMWHRSEGGETFFREQGFVSSILTLMAFSQVCGHLMQRVDSLEKTLMLGGIGGRRRRG
ncbi:unnamed protein product [Rangifer tarandus platyrhynchus]|uniref:Uncharacterized protein n=1 Tax=Rangifer tarandus platyrhynchus TaxID=3082113 RepID=A0ABN8YTN2_RANTA|nr:unnamed protein product [Rangifer tarandus platyrhynchus]